MKVPNTPPITPSDAIAEIVTKWRSYLKELPSASTSSNDQRIAGYMVGAVLEAGPFEEFIDTEPLLAATFEYVTMLETPVISKGERRKLWTQVTANVAGLEEKYL